MSERDPLQQITRDLTTGTLNRRGFIRRAVALGVPAALLNALRAGGGAGVPAAAAAGTDDGDLPSPMAGKLVKWLADDGARLSEGDPVAVLEAMKMETTVRAHRSGTLGGADGGRGDSLARIDP